MFLLSLSNGACNNVVHKLLETAFTHCAVEPLIKANWGITLKLMAYCTLNNVPREMTGFPFNEL